MYEITKQKVNELTGEVTQTTEIKTTKKLKQDEFMGVYLEDLGGLMKLKGDGEHKVLACLWKYSTFYKEGDPGNTIVVNTKFLEVTSLETGLKERTIRNLVSSLSKKGLLMPTGHRGCYFLNPQYFFKGHSKDRKQCFTMILEYDVEQPNKEFDNE